MDKLNHEADSEQNAVYIKARAMPRVSKEEL